MPDPDTPGHGTFITRREALLSSVLAPLVARCAGLPPPKPIPAAVPRKFIDAHCHVFNANDIPIVEFIGETALPEYPDKKEWRFLAEFIARAVALWVKRIDHEACLVDGSTLEEFLAVPARDDDRVVDEVFSQALEDLRQRAYLGTPQQLRQLEDKISSKVAPVRPYSAMLLDATQTSLSFSSPADTLNFLFDYYGLSQFRNAVERARQQYSRTPLDSKAAVPLGRYLPPGSIDPLSRLVIRDSRTGGGRIGVRRYPQFFERFMALAANGTSADIGSLLYLVRLVMHPRLTNIGLLDQTLGVSVGDTSLAQPGTKFTRLYTPSLIDFDCWYGVTSSRPMNKQTELMGKLAKLQPNPDLLANGYVPFDPLRMYLMKTGVLQGEKNPLDVVKHAIEMHGFAGVKIYPPMGFHAYFNAGRHNCEFGKHANKWVHLPPNGLEIGKGLDSALDDLYRYCLKNEVPILAHSANSQASFVGSGVNAEPQWWQKLLDRTDGGADGEFRNLRINLGHFGGIWCHDMVQMSQMPNDGADRCEKASAWTATILSVVASGRYPHLYFDIGDLGDIAVDSDAITQLAAFLNMQPSAEKEMLRSRLIYGTDWIFLVLAGQHHVDYIHATSDLVEMLHGASPKAIFYENTARFLGLVEGEKTAHRLRAFYKGDPHESALKRLILPRSAPAMAMAKN
jgi:predicted TIM-barrel fold metal-dependent hydrolase